MSASETISKTRNIVFGLTGVVCIAYGALALTTGRPDPMPFWIPGVLGVLAAIILVIGSFFAGAKQSEMAWDEGYRSEQRRAAEIAFWFGIIVHFILSMLLFGGMIEINAGFVASGILPAGVYLMLIVWFGARGHS